MNTLNLQNVETPVEPQYSLENFVITAADEEAIRDAVEQQLRGMPVQTQEQN